MLERIKNNIHLIIVISAIVSIFTITTILLIIRTNNNETIEKKSFFKHNQEVQAVDVMFQYGINPIEIVNMNNKIQIYGLKDENLENNINTLLNSLSKNESYTPCNVNFNVSNILSISCGDKHINLNLTNGRELTIEDIFVNTENLEYVLLEKIQKLLCERDKCLLSYNPNKLNDIENKIAESMDNIRLGKYNLNLNYKELKVFIDGLENYITFPFYENKDNIAIFNRFKDEKNIYKNSVQNTCSLYSCMENNDKKTMFEDGYTTSFKDKSIINFKLNSEINLKYSEFPNVEPIQNSEFLGKEILDKIIEQKELSNCIEDYSYIDIEATLYDTPYGYDIVKYNLIIKKMDRENFEKMSFGLKDVELIKLRDEAGINLIVQDDSKVIFKENNSDLFEDLIRDLSKYINSSIKKNGINSIFYISNGTSIEEIIRKSSYLVDIGNEQIFMHYFESDKIGTLLNEFVARIPLNKIKLK